MIPVRKVRVLWVHHVGAAAAASLCSGRWRPSSSSVRIPVPASHAVAHHGRVVSDVASRTPASRIRVLGHAAFAAGRRRTGRPVVATTGGGGGGMVGVVRHGTGSGRRGVHFVRVSCLLCADVRVRCSKAKKNGKGTIPWNEETSTIRHYAMLLVRSCWWFAFLQPNPAAVVVSWWFQSQRMKATESSISNVVRLQVHSTIYRSHRHNYSR
jgi:hypothetical protein